MSVESPNQRAKNNYPESRRRVMRAYFSDDEFDNVRALLDRME